MRTPLPAHASKSWEICSAARSSYCPQITDGIASLLKAKMAVLSVLRRSTWQALGTRSPFASSFYQNANNAYAIGQIRTMGHKRLMVIEPSRFQWKKFKDLTHFYFMVGIIPLSLVVFLVNIYVGPAQLAEIPEGYEPKHWEYYRHPIQRFFARYVYPSHQQRYEKNLHHLWVESEKKKLRLLEKKVKQLMAERGDYKAWYFVPFDGKYVRYTRKVDDESESLDAL